MSAPLRIAPLRVGLAGLGTVGTGVIRLVEENAALIARRAGRAIEIVAVTARDRTKDRGVDLSGYRWVDDMGELATADGQVREKSAISAVDMIGRLTRRPGTGRSDRWV